VLQGAEQVAIDSQLYLISERTEWFCCEEWPHISRFKYELAKRDEDETLTPLGHVDGYRITHDWTVEDDVQLWDEADALDGDIVRYVEALIREVRVCDQVFGLGPTLTHGQRVTVVRHVEAAAGVHLPRLTQEAVGALAVMDAPVFMLVDPWPMSSERRSPSGKLKGRGNFPLLLKLGFHRMVGSRFLWAWNSELADGLMHSYSYRKLRAALQRGDLIQILGSPVAHEVYGPMPAELAEAVDVPVPTDLTRE